MLVSHLLLQLLILITRSNILNNNNDNNVGYTAYGSTSESNTYTDYDRNFKTFVRKAVDNEYILPIYDKQECIGFVKKIIDIMEIEKYTNEEWCWEKERWDGDESGSGDRDESGSGDRDESGSGEGNYVDTCNRLLCYNCKRISSYIYEQLINNMDTIYTQDDIIDACRMLTMDNNVNPGNQTSVNCTCTCPEPVNMTSQNTNIRDLQVGVFTFVGSCIMFTALGAIRYLCKPIDPGFSLTA